MKTTPDKLRRLRPVDKLLLQPERYTAAKRQIERSDILSARRTASSVRPEKKRDR